LSLTIIESIMFIIGFSLVFLSWYVLISDIQFQSYKMAGGRGYFKFTRLADWMIKRFHERIERCDRRHE